MPGNNRKKLVESLLNNAADELQFLSYSDSEVDEIIEDLQDDLAVVSSFRYSLNNVVPKNKNWFEATLANLDEDRFKIMMRVSRQQFDVILSLIEGHKVFTGKNSGKQFTASFQLAVVLYRLGSSGEGATLGKIAALFGIGDGGTINKITDRAFESILALETTAIKWPNKEERDEIIRGTMDELPYCVGYIDGSEIPLAEAPTLDHSSYFSRCKQYSIKLQAICDPNYRIRHVMVGYPGSVHDARMFSNSGIGRNPEQFFSDEQWIAGDSAYKLTSYVITPFRKNSKEETYEIRRKFNKNFCKYRVRIEHCFGYLKERFNVLKGLRIKIYDAKSHESACKWIRACCVLYNIILPYLDENELELFASSFNEERNEFENIEDITKDNDKDGTIKRKALCELLLTNF